MINSIKSTDISKQCLKDIHTVKNINIDNQLGKCLHCKRPFLWLSIGITDNLPLRQCNFEVKVWNYFSICDNKDPEHDRKLNRT